MNLENIKKSISNFNSYIHNVSDYQEHYAGVIVDRNKDRYNRMKKKFDTLSTTNQLKVDFNELKEDINNWKESIDQPILDESVSLDDLSHDDLRNLRTTIGNEKIKNAKNINTDISNIFAGITDYYQGKGLSKYTDSVNSYNTHYEIDKTKYFPEKNLSNDILELFNKRKTLINYLKNHFTYVFIGKDKTFTFRKDGEKTLPIIKCKKNCIYNSQQPNEPFNNNHDKYIKSNDNKEIVKLLNNYSTFPIRLHKYLLKLGIDPDNSKRNYNLNYLKDNYCKCNTDTQQATDVDSYGCYKGYETRIFDSDSKCGPVFDNTTPNETEGFEQQIFDKTELQNEIDHIVNKIDNSYKSNNTYLQHETNELASFTELNKDYTENKKNEKYLKNNNTFLNQMIKDNILVSNRHSIIRYLIIIILIFSILLLMKYINIV
jgi:hypothetical protein